MKESVKLFTVILMLNILFSQNIFGYNLEKVISLKDTQNVAKPYIDQNSRLLIPIGDYSQYQYDFKYSQEFDEKKNKLTITGNNQAEIVFYNDQNYLTLNGQTVTMDTKCVPFESNDEKYLMVPARYLFESLGYSVSWDAHSKTAKILINIPTNTYVDVNSKEYKEKLSKYSFDDLLTKDLRNRNDNYVISSFSVKNVLGMLANGCNAETQNKILSVLGISNLDQYNLKIKDIIYNTSIEKVVKDYNEIKNSEYSEIYGSEIDENSLRSSRFILNISNSFWINKDSYSFKIGAKISDDFKKVITENYLATVSFTNNANAVNDINKWAEKQTNGRIKNLLNKIPKNFVSALCNAVYFNASWSQEFSPKNNYKGVFTPKDGKRVETEYMKQSISHNYFENEKYQLLRKYYSSGAYMYFLLPAKGYEDITIAEVMSTQKIEDFVDSDYETITTFAVPKFKIDYSFAELNEILKNTELSQLFNLDNTGITNILTPSAQLTISNVVQKATISIDENGTEAAAVTDLEQTDCSDIEYLYYDMILDRPFTFFVVYDDELLFSGQYNMVE